MRGGQKYFGEGSRHAHRVKWSGEEMEKGGVLVSFDFCGIVEVPLFHDYDYFSCTLRRV